MKRLLTILIALFLGATPVRAHAPDPVPVLPPVLLPAAASLAAPPLLPAQSGYSLSFTEFRVTRTKKPTSRRWGRRRWSTHTHRPQRARQRHR